METPQTPQIHDIYVKMEESGRYADDIESMLHHIELRILGYSGRSDNKVNKEQEPKGMLKKIDGFLLSQNNKFNHILVRLDNLRNFVTPKKSELENREAAGSISMNRIIEEKRSNKNLEKPYFD